MMRTLTRACLAGLTMATLAVTVPQVADAASTTTPANHRWFVVTPTIDGSTAGADLAMALAMDAGGYWQTQSNGRIGNNYFPLTVTQYVSTVATRSDCGFSDAEYDAVRSEALNWTKADLTAGDQILVVVPADACLLDMARGDVGTSFASGGFTIASVDETWPAVHEIGHLYGFGDAGLYTCGQARASCLDPHADVYDIMGEETPGAPGLPALNTADRVLAGITDPGEIENADPGSSTPQTWTIGARSATSGLRSIHLVDPATGNDMWLDYRSGTGQDFATGYSGGTTLDLASGSMACAPGVVIEERLADGGTAVIPASTTDAAIGSGHTWTNSTGSLKVSVGPLTDTSAEVTVTYGPAAIGTPTVTGVARVGRKLTGNPGIWDHTTTLARQWFVAGVPVAGATGDSFTPRAADRGKVVRYQVSATAGSTHVVRSASTAPVRAGVLMSSVPRIRGTARVGRTLRVSVGSWTTGTSLSYRWYAGGTAIKRAAKATLRLTKAMRGKRIVVKVTGHKTGYGSVVRSSKATARVRR